MKSRLSPVTLALALCASAPDSAHAAISIVATLPDLAAVAREIARDRASVTSLARESEDPHFVEPKPSFIRLLNRADALIVGGAELEAGWLPPLVQNARNARIQTGAAGFINAAAGVQLLQATPGRADRSEGDVHPQGNPHYLLDPANARVVAEHLAGAFARLDPANAEAYRASLREFQTRLAEKVPGWEKSLHPFRGTKVVTYHRSFDYLLARFEFRLEGTIEPKPGIEPSPSHIAQLTRTAKAAGVKLVIVEPNRPRRTAETVAQGIGAKLLVLPLMPGGSKQGKDFFSWFDSNLRQIAEALGS